MRWDYTELPNGMTYQKLRVAHLLTATTFEQVTRHLHLQPGGRADEHAVL